MSRLSSRQGWLLTVAAGLAMSVGLGLTLRQSSVVGQDQTAADGKARVAATQSQEPVKTPAELRNTAPVKRADDLSKAFRESARAAMPSVVTIHSHESAKKVRGNRGENPFGQFRGGENPFKGTPFENMIPQMPGQDGENGDYSFRTPSRDGVGSGVIIDSSGLILTNNHVVDGADKVTVHFADGREFTATDIKTDPQSDLAVVRIKADEPLPAAHLGNSDDLEIGDWVLAIGQPFEVENTVTAGIISGKGRELGGQRTKYLQTDAAINPGNSGGPLVNLTGEVIGINTAIASNSGGYQGIGFAIPINQAKWVTDQLVKNGSVSRGYLGVSIGEVTGDLASSFGVAKGEGVLVAEVMPNTPAAEAKMKDGDIITKFAGKEVHSPKDVQEMVERAPLNKSQPVEVVRDGKHVTLNVTVKSLPEKFGMTERDGGHKTPEAPATSGYSSQELGLQVADMTADEADTYHGFEGVMIKKVEPDSIAAEKGLRPGMLIRKVGKSDVKNVHDFETAMKSESLKTGVRFQVRTPAGNRFVVLQAQ
jgi:serine protease Do